MTQSFRARCLSWHSAISEPYQAESKWHCESCILVCVMAALLTFPLFFFEAVCSGVFANERELCDWKVLSQKLHHSVWNMAEHFALGT